MKLPLKIFFSGADCYHRYSELSKHVHPKETVLDVGGGPGIISQFLDNDITILDINKEELETSKSLGLKTIYADINDNSLKDNSYDVVVSVDTLEHIPANKRSSFLKELNRIAKKKLIIIAPMGNLKYDKILYKFKKLLGKKDRWTKEHLENGLPQTKDLKKQFPAAKITPTRNAYIWLTIMFLQSVPLLNRFLPGIVYIILKPFNRFKPFNAYMLILEK